MTTMIAEVYNAFRKAGVPDADAEAAAAAILPAAQAATKEDLKFSVAELKAEMAELKAEMAELRTEMAELKAELIRAMWLQAGVIIGALSLVFGGVATLIRVL
jgi:ribosomal protein L29